MKKYILKTILLAFLAGNVSSCIEEYLPSNGTVTADQVSNMSSGTSGLVTGILDKFGTGESVQSQEWDLGYPGLGMIRDIHCSDLPIYKDLYDYFYYFSSNTYLGGDWAMAYFPWKFYYDLVSLTHQVLKIEYSENNQADFGLAHFFRAWAYFDMARWYEYKKTGLSSIDAKAEANNVYGLTVPIFDENITEADAFNTPRAPFYDMYRFILDDLEKAEEYLAGSVRSSKNRPDVSTVYGFKARLYLDMGTRFQNSLNNDWEQYKSSGVDLGVNSAQDCYIKAAEYARKAISTSGASPLTESEWYGGSSYTEGFNSVNSNSWMLGVIIQKEQLAGSWTNFIGHMSPEQHFGVGGIALKSNVYTNSYFAQRCISSDLYNKISDSDWRKLSWLAPEDAGKANTKYKTSVNEEHFKLIPAYASFKFRPKNGERSDYSVGAAADYPLMRVEEMYFIEAEALAYSQGLSAGISALENFINTNRYSDGSYHCNASDMNSFIEQLMIQKRIEFWGEGIIFWDYKRLNMQVIRGYEGTNFVLEAYRLNSLEGYCAPWLIASIPTKEYGQNTAIQPNPDCSDTQSLLWTGN